VGLTDLFAASCGIAQGRVTGAIPPSCCRGLDAPSAIQIEGDCAVVVLPEWVPRQPARHLLPALSILSAEDWSFRFEVSGSVGGRWSPWIASAAVGSASFHPLPPAAEGLRSEVDVFLAEDPVERVRLRIRVHPARALTSPWLATLSSCDLALDGVDAAPSPRATSLPVPVLSQMEESATIRERICSPTCVAMVLAYWTRPVEVGDVSAEIFHPGLDLYGIWPAAIRAGARRGMAGYLLRFPDWAAALWCLDRGMPVIASIRYGEGELHGAAVPRTTGHLVVLAGHDGGDVLVNDPAARTRGTVARRYRRDELTRVWLERAGVGYVFFEP
jgi:hypothetical protein